MSYRLKKYSWFVGSVLLVVLSIMLMIVSTNSNTARFAQQVPVSTISDVIHNDLVNIVIEGNAPGMVAVIISSDGIIDIASAGVRKAGSDVAFTCNDVVHLGSCGKAMTSTMLATLVAEGTLSWDMKLTDAIPELANIIHPDYQHTTLWQLLTHRAGLPKNPIDESAHTDKDIIERRLAILTDNLVSAAPHDIGDFHYSNFGYMIAACMAERITGVSWEDLMGERLFEPLGMTTAGFGDPNENGSIDKPWGHDRFWTTWSSSDSYYPKAGGPAGEIYCSLEDWAKFLSLQLGSDQAFLDSALLKQLITPVGFYAAGWGVAEHELAQGIVLSHMGSNGIWHSSVMLTPALDRAYIVATNSCEWGFTENVCNEMLSKLVRMDLDRNKSPLQ